MRRGRASPATITRTSGWPFHSRSGNPINQNWLRHLFARLIKRAGLPGHTLTTACATPTNNLLYMDGVQGQPPCAIMGHAREDFN